MQYVLAARERRDQHDERGLRQVEIRDKRIHHLEAVAGIDVDIRPARARLHVPILLCPALKRAAGGGADADHTPAIFPCLVDERRRLRRDDAVFAVHTMLLDVVFLDGTERAEADMQRHIADVHTLLLNLFQQLRREVQSRRRRGRAALDLGVDRLVALLIGKLFFDVGRQGILPRRSSTSRKIPS